MSDVQFSEANTNYRRARSKLVGLDLPSASTDSTCLTLARISGATVAGSPSNLSSAILISCEGGSGVPRKRLRTKNRIEQASNPSHTALARLNKV